MKTMRSWIVAVAAVALAPIWASVDAFAERRVAMVVGNAAYKAAGLSLANPHNDAEDMSAALKGLGFEVVTTYNATKRDMDLALQQFARLATGADSALFFYAGHAMQFQGRNYLLPTDAELEDEISVRFQTVNLEDARAALDRTNGVRIMIIDACRNNPLATRLQNSIAGASRTAGSTTRGLAPMDKTQGMLVAYATAADDVAQDGVGRNSPFTTALLKRLQEPGLEIGIMFRRVASDVNAQTNGRQRPETSISLLSEYYLNQNDRLAWDRIKDQDDVPALRDFVTRYPSSPLAITARNRLDLLEEARRAREDERRKLTEAEVQRVAEEQKRQEAQRQQQEEQKRQEAQRQQQEEQKRQEAQRQQQEEQKRQEAQRRQQEEQKRQEAQRRQQEEQKRQEALRQQQEEQKRQEALRQQQEEQKRHEALRQQQEEQQHLAALPQKPDEPPARVHSAPPAPGPATQPARVNLPEQIRQAQTELRRLGCYTGSPDSQLNDATRNAIRAFWQHARRPVVEISITDGFIADLKRQPGNVCAPPARPSPPVASGPATSAPVRRNAADVPPPRPAAPAPQQEPARATAGSSPVMGIGGF